MSKIVEKLMCIRSTRSVSNINQGYTFDDKDFIFSVGNVYEVEYIGRVMGIIDNDGDSRTYHLYQNCFVTLDEWRNRNIDKVLR
jgi:hypothetical protein